MKQHLWHFWKNNQSLILFLFLMVLFRTTLADWNTVPTGSMKPTIIEGDRILVNKIAYDLKVPFTHITLKKFSDPKRGDIVIFESEKAQKRLVKRVIGLPGDKITMLNNMISINDNKLKYKILAQDKDKLIAEEKYHTIHYRIKLNRLSNSTIANFDTIKVPANAYLVLGDNRDNSADSRFIGFVPREEIIGRARHVVMSLNYENYYLPRMNRFMHLL